VTVNTLPDDIFREIFAFYLSFYRCSFKSNCLGYWDADKCTKAWQRLVHVCQRWRDIIYGSPCYLDLHLHCSVETPFRKNLGRWPEFPLTLEYIIDPTDDDDDFLAALEHPDRVHRAILFITSPDSLVVHNMLEAMQVPFPILTHLDFAGPDEDHEFLLPEEFLGGSAPCLQYLRLEDISFPTLPKLLLSARSLVFLELERVPPPTYFGYFSPEAIVKALAGLTKLRTLRIKLRFNPPDSDDSDSDSDEQPEEKRLERRRPDLSTSRALFPALNEFVFRGSSWYLEDLFAQIDAPYVEDIKIEYLGPEVEVCQLSQFIGRTPKFSQFTRAQLAFDFRSYYNSSSVELDHPQGECHPARFSLSMKPLDAEVDYQVLCMTRVLGQLGAMLSDVGQLSVNAGQPSLLGEYRMDNTQWIPLFHVFPAVETLHVTGNVAGHIASTLRDIAEESVMEVLPALQSLSLSVAESRFLSLRRLCGRPVTIVNDG
jgi:hypothetical protein